MVKHLVGIRSLAVVTICAALASPLFAADHVNKPIESMIPPDYRPCLFFTLQGVSMADGNVPIGGAWFAVPNDAAGYKEIYALILASKLTGVPLSVRTDGTACGFAKAYQVYAL